jgi:hypothetical protein
VAGGLGDWRQNAPDEGKEDYFPVIRNSVVPQEEHFPWMALRPFLKVTVLVEVISLFFFSFTQKACVMDEITRLHQISEG